MFAACKRRRILQIVMGVVRKRLTLALVPQKQESLKVFIPWQLVFVEFKDEMYQNSTEVKARFSFAKFMFMNVRNHNASWSGAARWFTFAFILVVAAVVSRI